MESEGDARRPEPTGRELMAQVVYGVLKDCGEAFPVDQLVAKLRASGVPLAGISDDGQVYEAPVATDVPSEKAPA